MRRSYRHHSGSGRGSLSCSSTQSSIEALRLWQACAGWIYCCPGAHSSSSLAGGEPVSGRCNPHPPLFRASRSPPVVPPPPTHARHGSRSASAAANVPLLVVLPPVAFLAIVLESFRPSASPGPTSQRALDPTHHPFLCGFVVLSIHTLTHIVHVTRSRAARRFPAAHGNGASDGQSVRWRPASPQSSEGPGHGPQSCGPQVVIGLKAKKELAHGP